MIKKKIRKKSTGIKSMGDRFRLSVFRSNAHIYAQIIDDQKGHTLVSMSSLQLSPKASSLNKDIATKVGKELAQKVKAANINTIVFDRGRYPYKGCIAILADELRKSGVDF